MSKFINLAGEKFGKLTVIDRIQGQNKNTMWNCLCECGNATIASSNNLKSGNVRSCGCIRGIHKESGHGDRKISKEYQAWKTMRRRCLSETYHKYPTYGARGITICSRWADSYEKFLEDMGRCPDSSMSLDRIDNNGNYCLENCRWATIEQQARNKSNNRNLTFRGKTQTLAEWSREVGISDRSLRDRLKRGWSLEKALTTPSLFRG